MRLFFLYLSLSLVEVIFLQIWQLGDLVAVFEVVIPVITQLRAVTSDRVERDVRSLVARKTFIFLLHVFNGLHA